MKADGILTIVGGVITLLIGIVIAFFGYGLSSVAGSLGAEAGIFGIVGLLGLLGVIFGLAFILLPIFAYPKKKNWAILGLVLSIISLLLGQGFFVGPILTIIGSALAVKNFGKK